MNSMNVPNTHFIHVYFVSIVIAFARIIVATSAQNRVQKRRSLPDKLSLHRWLSFCCSASGKKNIFVFSRHLIWQEMKPVQKRFRDRPATGIVAEINGFSSSGSATGLEEKGQIQLRQELWQDAFLLNLAVKPVETLFTTAILAEKRR